MANEDMELFREALDKWGIEAQRTMCIEECAELINALAKETRGRSTNDDILTRKFPRKPTAFRHGINWEIIFFNF